MHKVAMNESHDVSLRHPGMSRSSCRWWIIYSSGQPLCSENCALCLQA